MFMPQDPEMLYSIINMKLRDSYDSLDSLCDDADISRSEIEARLNAVGYFYKEEINQFR